MTALIATPAPTLPRCINLLPSPLLARRAVRRRARAWAIAGAVLGVVVAFSSLQLVAIRPGDSDAVHRQLRDTSRSVDALRRAIAADSSSLKDLRRAVTATHDVAAHPDWSVLLRLVADATGPQVVLERLEINEAAPAAPPGTPVQPGGVAGQSESYRVTMAGLATTAEDAFAFVRELEKFGLFEGLALRRTQTRSAGTQVVTSFNLDGWLTPRPAGWAPATPAVPTGERPR